MALGAHHPRILSNTYKLYLKGWTGLTIEPNPDVAAAFQHVRPRDTHLTIGIADQASDLTYYKFRDSGQNTFDAARAADVDSEKVGEVAIPCMPLNDVFERYCRDCPVDMLNVDCEGLDLQVIQSLDWQRHRPTLLIVEDFKQFDAGAATSPESSAIRSFMLEQDYAIVAQAIFSFFYVDRRAFGSTNRASGFRLDRSQLGMLASH